jgi:hypothetical protein
MTINIITGTISGRDAGGFREILPIIGYQWYYTKKGWGFRKNKNIKFSVMGSRLGLIDIIQTTGSGKTILAAINLFKANRNGDKTAANMPFTFLTTEIKDFEEFISLTGYKILLDDIRHVIQAFGTDDGKITSEAANSTRKKFNELFITTQRLENFVPPDLRKITDEYHVPIIRCYDATRKSPDKRNYFPLEICDLRFSAGMEYLDMKRYNLAGKTGIQIMNSFNTLDISKGLNQNEHK